MRIEQSATFFTDVLARVRKGTLVAPAFQRPYVWSKQDVEAFWKSLLRGWPIGSVLIWSPKDARDLARGRIGPISVPADSSPSLILDGQNRLATFAWSLLTPGTPLVLPDGVDGRERDTWASGESLVADPETRSVRFVPTQEASSGARVPPGLLIDTPALWKIVRQRGEAEFPDHLLKWLFEEAESSVRSARVSVTEMVGGTLDEAIEAFLHVGRAGVPVSEDDLRAALALKG